MKVIFLNDLSGYRSKFSEKIWTEKQSGKFVQIKHGDAEYLIFSPKELTRFHADIVKRFCDERGIEGIFNAAEKRFDIFDPDWEVIGGGKFELDRGEKKLRLYDDSMAYGRFDAKGLKKKTISIEIFSDFSVRIE